MPVPGLTHRYPDRVLWYVSHNCAVYCRHCMRKRKVSQASTAPGKEDRERAFEYISSQTQIREVILSGGDPLSQSDAWIHETVGRLAGMEQLSSIRIHSRMPVTCPSRITSKLCSGLVGIYHLTFVTHFNHPLEITPEATEAVRRLKRAGMTVLNQSVLLKGVNDSLDTLKTLSLNLLRIGVQPYYLHQCDEVAGVAHFRTDLNRGLELMKGLRGRIPGIGLPQYVIDLPGGGGKVPVDSSYFVNRDFQAPVFKNYKGYFHYPVPDDVPTQRDLHNDSRGATIQIDPDPGVA